MGEAIGEVLPVAVGVAVSPVPIIAVILMLVTARARVNGPAFIVGWLLGLAAVGAIVMAVLLAWPRLPGPPWRGSTPRTRCWP